MDSIRMITALCTPLTDDEQVHREGLKTHIQEQLDNGIESLLIVGSMGVMQLLSDETYREVVRQSVDFAQGRAELLVGVGDTSYARTCERIRMIEDEPIDGVVVVTPYFFPFDQSELLDYFQSLAEISSKPLFLYDLPKITKTKIEVSTVLELARHPNIRGIKITDHFPVVRPLLDANLPGFRTIVSQPFLIDVLLRSGVKEHLDGVFGFVPEWIQGIVQAAEKGDWDTAAIIQRDVSELLNCLFSFPAPLFATIADLMQQRGISGTIAPRPFRALTPDEQERFREIPIVRKALSKQVMPLEKAS